MEVYINIVRHSYLFPVVCCQTGSGVDIRTLLKLCARYILGMSGVLVCQLNNLYSRDGMVIYQKIFQSLDSLVVDPFAMHVGKKLLFNLLLLLMPWAGRRIGFCTLGTIWTCTPFLL